VWPHRAGPLRVRGDPLPQMKLKSNVSFGSKITPAPGPVKPFIRLIWSEAQPAADRASGATDLRTGT